MTKSDIVRIADLVITMKSVYQELSNLRDREQDLYDNMSDDPLYAVEREIMLENIEGLEEALEEFDFTIDKVREVLNNNK